MPMLSVFMFASSCMASNFISWESFSSSCSLWTLEAFCASLPAISSFVRSCSTWSSRSFSCRFLIFARYSSLKSSIICFLTTDTGPSSSKSLRSSTPPSPSLLTFQLAATLPPTLPTSSPSMLASFENFCFLEDLAFCTRCARPAAPSLELPSVVTEVPSPASGRASPSSIVCRNSPPRPPASGIMLLSCSIFRSPTWPPRSWSCSCCNSDICSRSLLSSSVISRWASREFVSWLRGSMTSPFLVSLESSSLTSLLSSSLESTALSVSVLPSTCAMWLACMFFMHLRRMSRSSCAACFWTFW
mmetsp:Transcript_90381/g.255982  ORF Transcript_90381/g.255982 Transcript_90381/m.255982 type:complete len:302 (-) Transcript_90381:201-1106(-)